ncbi:MAG: hypothetical protein ACOCWM_02865 [Cyclobacteriaceae bacterium]
MMKKIILLIGLVCTFSLANLVKAQTEAQLVELCASSAGDDATYLKDFIADLPGAGPDEKPPVAKFSMVLSKSTLYRFSICNSDSKPGKGIIQLYDMNTLIGSSYNAATGKEYPSFNFQCNKTGVYHLFLSFQDGKPGYSVGILSFIKKL